MASTTPRVPCPYEALVTSVGLTRPRLRPSSDTEEIAIVGTQAREARELAVAAEAVGIVVRPLAFGSHLADAALAAHGPGSVRLPLVIVAGRYSLQRPALRAVLECIDVVRGTGQTLPAACVTLDSTAEATVHIARSAARGLRSPGSGDDRSPEPPGNC